MLFPVVFVCILALGSSHTVTPRVDYTTCTWLWAYKGVNLECDDGFIAIGECGSLTMSNCNSQYSHGLQCCAILGECIQFFFIFSNKTLPSAPIPPYFYCKVTISIPT